MTLKSLQDPSSFCLFSLMGRLLVLLFGLSGFLFRLPLFRLPYGGKKGVVKLSKGQKLFSFLHTQC